MTTEVAVLKTNLALADVAQKTLSSPALVRLRRISLSTINYQGTTRYFLPAGLSLADDDRNAALGLLRELRRFYLPDHGPLANKERFALISKMLLSKPIKDASELVHAARNEAYEDALDGFPPWAIDVVRRRWNCGECGTGHDYTWAPEPHVWRQLVKAELTPYGEAIRHLEALLEAEPFDVPDTRQDEREELAGSKVTKANETERKAPLPFQPRNILMPLTRTELQRREAEQIIARCKVDPEAFWGVPSRRPSALSVFDLDPDNWDA